MKEFCLLFETIQSEGFSKNIALGVCIADSIRYCTIPKNTDFLPENKGKYTLRVKNKIQDCLSNNGYDTEEINQVIDLWDCIHSWEIGRSFDGIGGCKYKTFKELLEKNNN